MPKLQNIVGSCV